MPASTSMPESVLRHHEPTLPTEADIERLSELFGAATGELERVQLRLVAYLQPFSEPWDEPAAVLPTFEDIGRLTVMIDNLKAARGELTAGIQYLERAVPTVTDLQSSRSFLERDQEKGGDS